MQTPELQLALPDTSSSGEKRVLRVRHRREARHGIGKLSIVPMRCADCRRSFDAPQRRPMNDTKEPWVQLATRIPKSLHRSMKLHTVVAETTVMQFVVDAINEKLAREQGRRRKRA